MLCVISPYQFYYNAVKLSLFIIAIVSMVIMYILIGHTVYRHAQFRQKFRPAYECNDTPRKDNSSESTAASEENSSRPMTIAIKKRTYLRKDHQSKQRVTKIAFAMSVLFILSFLPHLVLATVWAQEGDVIADSVSVTSSLLSLVLRSVYMNSAGNPFVYWVLDKRFRRFLKTDFCGSK